MFDQQSTQSSTFRRAALAGLVSAAATVACSTGARLSGSTGGNVASSSGATTATAGASSSGGAGTGSAATTTGSSGSSSGGPSDAGPDAGACQAGFTPGSDDPVGAWNAADLVLTMDVNGDHKTDLVILYQDAGQTVAQVLPSNGSAFTQASNASVGGWNTAYHYLPMDVNGDHQQDLVVIWENGTKAYAQVSLSNGSEFNQSSNAAVGGWDSATLYLPMDVNADGKSDLVILWDNAGNTSAQVNLSNGTGFTQVSNAAVGTWDATSVNLTGDVDGDGKPDLVRLLASGANATAEIWLSNGTGFAQASANVIGAWAPSLTSYRLADVDGDGRADLIALAEVDGGSAALVSLSTGTAFGSASSTALGAAVAGTRTLFEDVDGDGRTDLVQVFPNGSLATAQVWPSTGKGFIAANSAAAGSWDPSWIDLPMQVEGTGLGDLVVLWQDPTQPAGQDARARVLSSDCRAATSSSTGTTTGATGASSSGTASGTTSGSSSGTASGTTSGGVVSPIGPDGGSVSLLHFGVTGDTRPGSSNAQGITSYPTAVIDGIAQAFTQSQAQFVMDLGDHMNNWQNATTAQGQMALYQDAMALYPGQWFLTMGNHECDTSAEVCIPGTGQTGSTAGNFTTFLSAVAQTGVGQLPWYSFNVQTSLGLATFVVIADNAWCPAEQTWLQNVLTQADTAATYTILARHHPPDDTSNGDATSLTEICTVVRQHKFALWLSGHVHEYLHIPSKDNDRDVIAGTAGAPLGAASNALAFFGYLLVDQLPSGDLQVTAWDSTTNLQMDQWSVGPN